VGGSEVAVAWPCLFRHPKAEVPHALPTSEQIRSSKTSPVEPSVSGVQRIHDLVNFGIPTAETELWEYDVVTLINSIRSQKTSHHMQVDIEGPEEHLLGEDDHE